MELEMELEMEEEEICKDKASEVEIYSMKQLTDLQLTMRANNNSQMKGIPTSTTIFCFWYRTPKAELDRIRWL